MHPFPESQLSYPANNNFVLNPLSRQAQNLQAWWSGRHPNGANWWKTDVNGPLLGSSYNGQTGTGVLTNGCFWVPSPVGPAIDFTAASSQYVDTGQPNAAPNDLAALTGRNFSLSAWFNLRGTNPAAAYGIFGGGFGTYYLRAIGDGTVQFVLSKNAVLIAGTTVVPYNSWHHICVTISVGDVSNVATHKLYLDGKLEGTSTHGVTFGLQNQNRLRMGCDSNIFSSPDEFFEGQIADVRIYTWELSAERVMEMYDPATRFDLYLPIESNLFGVYQGGAAAVRGGDFFSPMTGF